MGFWTWFTRLSIPKEKLLDKWAFTNYVVPNFHIKILKIGYKYIYISLRLVLLIEMINVFFMILFWKGRQIKRFLIQPIKCLFYHKGSSCKTLIKLLNVYLWNPYFWCLKMNSFFWQLAYCVWKYMMYTCIW